MVQNGSQTLSVKIPFLSLKRGLNKNNNNLIKSKRIKSTLLLHTKIKLNHNLLIFCDIFFFITIDCLIKSPFVWLFNEITHIAIVIHPVYAFIPFDHIRLDFNLTLKG